MDNEVVNGNNFILIEEFDSILFNWGLIELSSKLKGMQHMFIFFSVIKTIV